MERTELFLRVGFLVWEIYKSNNPGPMQETLRSQDVATLFEQLAKADGKLTTYLLENRLMLPLQSYKNQPYDPDEAHSLAAVAFLETEPHLFLTPDVLCKAIASLDLSEDYITASLRIRDVVNRLILRQAFVIEEDNQVGLSAETKKFITRNDVLVLGGKKADYDAEISKAKKKSSHSKHSELTGPAIPVLSAKEIERRLQTLVVGAHEVVKVLSCRLALHLNKARLILNGEKIQAPNEVILLIGSPSSGKTYIASCLAKILSEGAKKIPFTEIDAASCSEVGYVGLDASEIIPKNLINSAGGNLALSSVGLTWIDELDKRCYKTSASNATDISAGMQFSILKLCENGTDIILNEKRYSREPPIKWTSHLFILMGGAFEGLDQILKHQARESGGIGFGEVGASEHCDRKLFTALLKYGISRQLLSRCTAIITVPNPNLDDLKNILSRGVLVAYNEILQSSGLGLSLSEDAKSLIATHALENGTFGRGMKSIVGKLAETVMYEARQVEFTAADVTAILDGYSEEPIPRFQAAVSVEGEMTEMEGPVSSCGN